MIQASALLLLACYIGACYDKHVLFEWSGFEVLRLSSVCTKQEMHISSRLMRKEEFL